MTPKYKGLQHRAGNDPRAAALLVVSEILTSDADSQAALDRRLKASSLVPGDKSLCTELTYGLLRRHLRLEWFLRQKLDKPDKLPAEVLLMLELAAYELAHTRIPAHASLNWTVNLVRNRFGRGLAGVANGVLRGFQRGLSQEYENPSFYLERLGLGEAGGQEEPAFLAVFYGMPEWIVRLWLKAYGPEKTRICLAAAQEPAPLGLRVNMLRPEARAVHNELSQARSDNGGMFWLEPDLAVLQGGGAALPLRRWLEQGLVSCQSPGAYQALWALRPRNWKLPIWDACSGRGGKSLALLEQGIPVALLSDASAARLSGFGQEFDRLFGPAEGRIANAPELPESKAGAAGGLPAGQKFGTVLLDVPCSGLGTLSHRPEIRWRRSPEDLEKLCASQAEILEAGAAALQPGGRLVYLTCTLNPAENLEQVELFLEKHPEFKKELLWDALEGQNWPQELVFFPCLGEFFCGAVLTR
ncbi:MAG: hypothetical protein LBM64_04140 [Deltaproteobacteria bacterium]|jgi:16S rRNA (cytosine967-C5)-methyltransferase|nr:hypothetical protein [Deltaproteobacteria bacterium]